MLYVKNKLEVGVLNNMLLIIKVVLSNMNFIKLRGIEVTLDFSDFQQKQKVIVNTKKLSKEIKFCKGNSICYGDECIPFVGGMVDVICVQQTKNFDKKQLSLLESYDENFDKIMMYKKKCLIYEILDVCRIWKLIQSFWKKKKKVKKMILFCHILK